MGQPPYEVAATEDCVEAWSAARLPFEPKHWLRDYRNEPRSALRSMKATPTGTLCAEYATPDDRFADLENVLLYNLGSGCYAHLAGNGIICRRTRSTDRLHHVKYSVTDRAGIAVPTGRQLANAELVDSPRGSTPTDWWFAFRQHVEAQDGALHEGEFGIRAEFGSAWTRDLAPSVKPLLDGLTAAVHVHDGSERDHVTAALNDVGDGDHLWALLNDPRIAILGRRCLVRPHGSRLAWNPADERCGYFELTRGTRREELAVTVHALTH